MPQGMQKGANFCTTLVLFYYTSDWLNQHVTKNYCVTWIIRVYANLVQKLREYLISLCHGD